MDRRRDATIATFFSGDEPLAPGTTVALGVDAAQHIRARRLAVGEAVHLSNGAGLRAAGTLVRVAKNAAAVQVDTIHASDPPPAVHLLVPIADRDRMLWLAEKCVELGATSWRPVLWRRSRSVTPRGDGPTFANKVRARMIAALTQCDGAWLPTCYPESTPERALAAAPAGTRIVLDFAGGPFPVSGSVVRPPVTLAVGPEGGFEPPELDLLTSGGFRAARLPTNVLRFETAVIAALAIARAALGPTREPAHGR